MTRKGGKAKTTRCTASGPLANALRKAIEVICLEFRLPNDTNPLEWGLDCASIRRECKEVTDNLLKTVGGPSESWRYQKLKSSLKSLARIFDVPCQGCDVGASGEAIKEWLAKVTVPQPILTSSKIHDPSLLLRRRIVELSEGWGKNLERAREIVSGVPVTPGDIYVPDQQGCAEVTRVAGGTLAVRPDECGPANLTRVGVAKTKGKLRVVTMQSARTKRMLSPLHNALYDHISSFGWCVRGNVTKDDFCAVEADRREGEKFISGDYTSATDNLSQDAVNAAIEAVIYSCGKNDKGELHMTLEEERELRESFKDIQAKIGPPCSTRIESIKRGSMMGNLLSFPLLCLINKACFDIAQDITEGGQNDGKFSRVGRFNGDDCLFCGDEDFYNLWRHVTSLYGFIVNKDKTHFSDRLLELNSQPYLVGSKPGNGKLVAKPVLSFFRPLRKECGELLGEVIEGVKTFSRAGRSLSYALMRHEIALQPISLNNIPPATFEFLIKQRWFRAALQVGPAPTKEMGVKRSVEVMQGPPPLEKFYPIVSELAASEQLEKVAEWRGVKLGKRGPYTCLLDRQKRTKHPFSFSPQTRYSRSCRYWSFMWPVTLYKLYESIVGEKGFVTKGRRRNKWLSDHPFLQVTRSLIVRHPPPQLHHPKLDNFLTLGPFFTQGMKCHRALGAPPPQVLVHQGRESV